MAFPFKRLPLPLSAALGAFVIYLVTLGRGLTFYTLPLAGRLAGWDHPPLVDQPVLWLLTLPLQVLPEAWIPLGVKLFAAAIAALIVGLLARTVQLLPWDHPWTQAKRLAVVLPVLTACAVCGLELSFWREATSTCVELVGLALLAAAVWLVLEYRARRYLPWLYAAAVVWGVGMAENWVMLLTLPLFISGIIWLLGLRFFRWQLILRLAALGLAGFSLYALPPMVSGLTPHSPSDLGQSWLATLRQTRNEFRLIHFFWSGARLQAVVVLIYFLVPTLPLLIRMRDEGMQNKSGVDQFQLWIYRALRVGLLLACLWLAFDPTIGLRQLARKAGFTWSMLTFDYLNAMGAAFLLGNLLLISQFTQGEREYRRKRPPFPWKRLVLPTATAGMALVAAGLLARNAPAIWGANFHSAAEYGQAAVDSLPPGRGIVLCDFPDRLAIFRAALARNHRTADWPTVNTRDLATVAYRAKLERQHPDGWLTARNNHELTSLEMVGLLRQVAQSNRLYYLHLSYGYFFETFYLEPRGLLYEMKLRPKDPFRVPPLTDALIASNEAFWTSLWNRELQPLAPKATPPNALEAGLARFGVVPAPRYSEQVLADWFSLPLEGWAVALQRHGDLAQAAVRLNEVLQLNTNSFSAQITRTCNANLQARAKMGLAEAGRLRDQLKNLDRLETLINNSGPFDHPVFDFLLGNSFASHNLLIQAAEQYDRARVLAPESVASELDLAGIYNRLQRPDLSGPLLGHLREESKSLQNSALNLDLALKESWFWLLETNAANARASLDSVAAQYPDDPDIQSRVMSAYVGFGDITNALRVADAQLARDPDATPFANSKALLLTQSGRAGEAVTLMDQVLARTNDPTARLNRAFAELARENFAPAKSDLHQLEQMSFGLPVVDFGLATVAQHDRDTNQAIHYLRLCLTNSPPDSAVSRQARARLAALQPASTPNQPSER